MKKLLAALCVSLMASIPVFGQGIPPSGDGSIVGDCNSPSNGSSGGNNGSCRDNTTATSASDQKQGQAQGQAQGQGQVANGGLGLGIGKGGNASGGTSSAEGGAGGHGGSGGSGGLGQAAINQQESTMNVVNNRSVYMQTPQAAMAAVTSNSGNMVSMSSACGPRVTVTPEAIKGVFFTLMSGQESVDLGSHDVVRPAQGSVFTEQRLPYAKATLLIGHQVHLACTRVAVAGQRGLGLGASGSSGSVSGGVSNGGLMETMMCKVAVSGCVAGTVTDYVEPAKAEVKVVEKIVEKKIYVKPRRSQGTAKTKDCNPVKGVKYDYDGSLRFAGCV